MAEAALVPPKMKVLKAPTLAGAMATTNDMGEEEQPVDPNTVAGATGGSGPTDFTIPDFQGTKGVAITHEVGDNELVQGQLARILGSDSPLLKNARGQAITYANERGLQNSSIAAEAGEKAMIESALPIAQQDAGTYSRTALTNQDAENQFEMANVGAKNNAEMANIAFAQQRQLGVDQERANVRMNATQFEQAKEMFAKDADLKRELQEIDARGRTAIAQAQISAASADSNARMALGQAEIASRERLAQMQTSIQQSQFADDLEFRRSALDSNTQTQLQVNSQNLTSNALNTYTNQFTAIMGTQMDPADRERALGNLNAMWAGSPYLPPGFFSSSAFGTPTPTPTPTPPPTPPDNGGGG